MGLTVIVLFVEKMKSAKTTKSTTTDVAAATTSISSSHSQMEEPVKIKHSFPICDSRSIQVDEDNDVSIVDERDNGKRAFFIAQRWVRFVQEIPSIDKAFQRAITYKPTNFKLHIGGQWYV